MEAAIQTRARRPRPPVVTLTDSAAERVREIMTKSAKPYLRVGVKNGGCAGQEYVFEYADAAGPIDEVVEEKGVSILIEPKAVLFPDRLGDRLRDDPAVVQVRVPQSETRPTPAAAARASPSSRRSSGRSDRGARSAPSAPCFRVAPQLPHARSAPSAPCGSTPRRRRRDAPLLRARRRLGRRLGARAGQVAAVVGPRPGRRGGGQLHRPPAAASGRRRLCAHAQPRLPARPWWPAAGGLGAHGRRRRGAERRPWPPRHALAPRSALLASGLRPGAPRRGGAPLDHDPHARPTRGRGPSVSASGSGAVVVTGGDAGYFPLVDELCASVRAFKAADAVGLAVIDGGMTGEQTAHLAGRWGARILDVGWGFDIPERQRRKRPALKVLTARTFLDQHLPNAGVIVWMDGGHLGAGPRGARPDDPWRRDRADRGGEPGLALRRQGDERALGGARLRAGALHPLQGARGGRDCRSGWRARSATSPPSTPASSRSPGTRPTGRRGAPVRPSA